LSRTVCLMFTFDAAVEFVDEGPRRRRVLFYDSDRRYQPSGIAAELTVEFDDEWRPTDVRFDRRGPTRATELRSFPWKRWFDLCREEILRTGAFDLAWNRSVHQAADELTSDGRTGPGRPSPLSGNEQWIADRRDDLRKAGVRPFWPELQKQVAAEFYDGDITRISIETLQSTMKRWNAKRKGTR
jgi:hypothetical protein